AQHVGACEGSRVALEMPSGAAREAVEAELQRLGAEPVSDGAPADTGIAYHEGATTSLAPGGLVGLIGSVAPGGRVAVMIHEAVPASEASALWGLRHPRQETAAGSTVVSGALPEPVKSSAKRRLRGLGHGMEASIQVGRPGLTEEALQAIQSGLRRHGLVKVKLTPQCSLDKSEAAREMAAATGSQLIQRVGKTALLYRSDVKLDPPTVRGGRRRS
ncbi:MAG: YhbY family RNA-binding protein, partial [Myxococcota bacterium]|nr:YhbY family RNA-binding protein [Myxococcota bacterium]